MNLINFYHRGFHIKRLYLNLVNNCFAEFYFDKWIHSKKIKSEVYTNLNY